MTDKQQAAHPMMADYILALHACVREHGVKLVRELAKNDSALLPGVKTGARLQVEWLTLEEVTREIDRVEQEVAGAVMTNRRFGPPIQTSAIADPDSF